MLGRFSVGKWTRDFSSFGGIQFQNLFLGKGVYTPGQYILFFGGGMFAGEKFMLQNRSFSCPTVVEFHDRKWTTGS